MQGGQSATPDSKKFAKNREKREKKSGKIRGKGRNREGSFTLPLLIDSAGYATVDKWNNILSKITGLWLMVT